MSFETSNTIARLTRCLRESVLPSRNHDDRYRTTQEELREAQLHRAFIDRRRIRRKRVSVTKGA